MSVKVSWYMHVCECMFLNFNTHSRMAYSYLAGCPHHLITASEHHNNAQKSYLIYTTLCCDLKRLKFWIQSLFSRAKFTQRKNRVVSFFERFLVRNIYGIWTVKHFFSYNHILTFAAGCRHFKIPWMTYFQ